ncbi:MAG: response regulator [Fibrobacterales bacterium]|nr:response regulator [Fibrobacterales bacterium]MBP5188822.1 response regulator [Fibrobacterales bacterium]MBP5351271.1 response regulator [Fibrobacterales bacterium]
MTKKKSETRPEENEEPVDEVLDSEESVGEGESGDDYAADEQIAAGNVVPAFTGERHVLIVEPDEERRKLMVAIATELMPNATLQEAEDDEEGEVALEEDEFQMVVMDLQVPGFSTSEFVRTVHNNESIVFVALSLDNFEPGDEKNRLKLDSLRKLFE